MVFPFKVISNNKIANFKWKIIVRPVKNRTFKAFLCGKCKESLDWSISFFIIYHSVFNLVVNVFKPIPLTLAPQATLLIGLNLPINNNLPTLSQELKQFPIVESKWSFRNVEISNFFVDHIGNCLYSLFNLFHQILRKIIEINFLTFVYAFVSLVFNPYLLRNLIADCKVTRCHCFNIPLLIL